MANQSSSKGFTLIESLVALAVITIISLVVIGALAPWIGLKQSVDTDRKLQDVKQGMRSYYESIAMAAEAQPAGQLGPFTRSTVDGTSACVSQVSAFEQVSGKFSDSPQQLARDGYANPWCFFISDPLSASRDGVTLWYRNIAIVSTGRDGILNPGTGMDPAGNLLTGGDDAGIVVSGYDIQQEKLKETLRRLSRVATMYETYFTTRFLAYPDRDITRDYFSSAYDTSGMVASTGGAWGPVSAVLASTGVGSLDAMSAWEQFNNIEVGNFNEQVGPVQVHSPATTGTGSLPYTALLRARIPAPGGQTLYATQVVVGNY